MAQVSVEIIGGLGNQLYGIAWARYLELKYGHTVNLISAVPSRGNNTHGTSWNGWEVFGKEVIASNPSKFERARQIIARFGLHQQCRVVHESVRNSNWESLPEHTIIRGYFQTDVAWRFLRSRSLLSVKPVGALFEALCPESADLQAAPNSGFLHMRFGDYEEVPGFAIDRNAYYSKALAKLLAPVNQTAILNVFSDEPRKAESFIDETAAAYPGVKFQLSGGSGLRNPISELLSMAQHPRGILANSTFSIWAGLLAGSSAQIFYPEPWFAKDSSHHRPAIPKEWTEVSWESGP